jgi:hypothetical protein
MVAEVVLEIVKIVFPAAIVFATAWYLLKNMLENQEKMRLYEIRRKEKRETIGLRLQAFERLALFLERISPGNLIPRVRRSGMMARELQFELISHIRQEYEHNLSQQIYVSSELWDTINYSKNDLIKVINLISTSLPEDADSMELAKGILDYYIKSAQGLPTEKALDLLKLEVRKLYQ